MCIIQANFFLLCSVLFAQAAFEVCGIVVTVFRVFSFFLCEIHRAWVWKVVPSFPQPFSSSPYSFSRPLYLEMKTSDYVACRVFCLMWLSRETLPAV